MGFIAASRGPWNRLRAGRRALLCAVAGTALLPAADFPFAHPGLLHSGADLQRMREAVAARSEPIFSGFELLRAHRLSQATYRMQGPFEEIGRNPSVHFSEFDQDAGAAYQNALMWAITGEAAHAGKAKEILNAWASRLQRVSGADAVLMASLGPFKLVNAAEIVRHTGAGWPEADARRFARMCRDALYPAIQDFALFANGNWDTAAVKTMAAIGVYSDDRALFERALRYYVDGPGDGRLTHYIYPSGQCQENGRDQAHTQLGLGHLGDTAEIAWHQGLDLYAYAGNRLLAGFEYTARYILGEPVPFAPDLDRTGKYAHAAIAPRGPLRPIYEQIYNHYAVLQGIAAPFSQRAAEKLRPEGAAAGADHPGFGTLLFTRAMSGDAVPLAVPVPPGALVARPSADGIRLTWIRPRGAAGYTVKRATSPGGPYTAIATNLQDAEYTDAKVKPGTLYCYAVAAGNVDSVETKVFAGLPAPWRATGEGEAMFDGGTFTLEAAGAWHFVECPLAGDGSVTARFVPPVSAQSSRMGVTMSAGRTAGSARIALLLTPAFAGPNRERPDWHASLVQNGREISAGPSLDAPHVSWGRLMQPYWLRLTRAGNRFAGFVSADGETWVKVAETTLPLPHGLSAGLAASSGLEKMTTTVRFDRVGVERK